MSNKPDIEARSEIVGGPREEADMTFEEKTVSYTHLTLPTNREV